MSVVRCFGVMFQPSHCPFARPWSKTPIWPRTCSRTPSTAPHKPWRNTTLRRSVRFWMGESQLRCFLLFFSLSGKTDMKTVNKDRKMLIWNVMFLAGCSGQLLEGIMNWWITWEISYWWTVQICTRHFCTGRSEKVNRHNIPQPQPTLNDVWIINHW